ncbi:MAG: hypothetical protein ACXAC7_09760 [Candidatus Hodarchaeales archaeon]|jgi:hypothetical protein
MVYELHILYKGNNVFYHCEGSGVTTKKDFLLITGFFSAFMSFAKEIIEEKIQQIQFENLRVYFKQFKEYIIILMIRNHTIAQVTLLLEFAIRLIKDWPSKPSGIEVQIIRNVELNTN